LFGVEKGGRLESLDPAVQAEMVSAAMREHGPDAHAKALAPKRGVEWESLDHAGREQMVSAAMSELGHPSGRGGPRQVFGFGQGKGRVGVVGSCGASRVEKWGPQ